MKRIIAILLAVCCTAFAQLPALGLLAPSAEKCGCCETPGTCGRSECAVPPSPATTASATEPTVLVASVAVRRVLAGEHSRSPKFFAAFVAPTRESVLLRARIAETPPAREPLFKAHCSFLL
jgi:hypothetical protein